jgi:hypothetical protein
MPEFQLHLGHASFLQPATKTRLVSHGSVNVSTEVPSVNGCDFSLPSFIASDIWTRARPCFTISFLISFDEISASSGSQRTFLKQLGQIITEAEVGR